jgi:hypothetical protein
MHAAESLPVVGSCISRGKMGLEWMAHFAAGMGPPVWQWMPLSLALSAPGVAVSLPVAVASGVVGPTQERSAANFANG